MNVLPKDLPPTHLCLYDTAGQEDYDRLRPLSYPATDIFLVCFSVDSNQSLDNVAEVWVPEIRHYCPHAPFLLVGLKTDLRESSKGRGGTGDQVTYDMGKKAARRLGAVAYMECSALTHQGIKAVFDKAVSHLAAERIKKRRCRCWRGRCSKNIVWKVVCGVKHRRSSHRHPVRK